MRGGDRKAHLQQGVHSDEPHVPIEVDRRAVVGPHLQDDPTSIPRAYARQCLIHQRPPDAPTPIGWINHHVADQPAAGPSATRLSESHIAYHLLALYPDKAGEEVGKGCCPQEGPQQPGRAAQPAQVTQRLLGRGVQLPTKGLLNEAYHAPHVAQGVNGPDPAESPPPAYGSDHHLVSP